MSGKLKVEFIDNSSYQYDSNAARIKLDCFGSKWGKLYIGDRNSASYVQLKFRECRTVVSCSADMHMFCKESDVKYLKIDPSDEKNNHLEEVLLFVDAELRSGKNVVVHCENGNGKSVAVMMYYVMKKGGMSLADSYRFLEGLRDIRVAPSLITVLMKEEKNLRGCNTVKIEDRKVVLTDAPKINKLPTSSSKKTPVKSNPYLPLYILGGVGLFFGVVFGVLVMITGKV